jgi:hypothetical protein
LRTTRRRKDYISSRIGYLEDAEPISVRSSDNPAYGFLDINSHTYWYYSLDLFPEPEALKSAISALIDRATSEGRTAANNATVCTVFVIGPDKKIKLMLAYPMTTGRNFDEVLRVLDSIQLTAVHKVATPVNWKSGDDVIILCSQIDRSEHAQARLPWTRSSGNGCSGLFVLTFQRAKVQTVLNWTLRHKKNTFDAGWIVNRDLDLDLLQNRFY